MTRPSLADRYSFEIICSLLITLIVSLYFVFPRTGQAEVETADSLNRKVMSLYQAGKYGVAVPIALKVLKIREKTQGTDHPDVAVALQTLAGLYEAAGDYAKAAPFDKRALAILEKNFGKAGDPEA